VEKLQDLSTLSPNYSPWIVEEKREKNPSKTGLFPLFSTNTQGSTTITIYIE
jgi:hypothetical protein